MNDTKEFYGVGMEKNAGRGEIRASVAQPAALRHSPGCLNEH